MIYSGLVILAFLGLHFYDFWIPEIQYKYIEFQAPDEHRYFAELVHKFENPTAGWVLCRLFHFIDDAFIARFSVSISIFGSQQ